MDKEKRNYILAMLVRGIIFFTCLGLIGYKYYNTHCKKSQTVIEYNKDHGR